MDNIINIQQLIARFATSFDVKDWDGLQACLTESLFTDYSDLRGSPPQTITAAEYVSVRRSAQEQMKMHHLVSNYEIDIVDAETATCRASMIIWRKSGGEDFTSHCVYTFQLKKQGDGWKINSITQKILWNEGTPVKS